MVKSILEIKKLVNLYVAMCNSSIVGFDHLGLKYLYVKFEGIKMKKDWQIILQIALEIIEIIIMIFK